MERNRATALLSIVVAVWIAVGALPYFLASSWSVRGQIGDMFGATNALFSALAFAGVLYTIHLQREELGLQRQELEQTRLELARTASAQEAAERNLAQQAAALEATARLNALAAAVEHFGLKLDRSAGVSAKEEALQQRDRYAGLLEKELAHTLGSRPATHDTQHALGVQRRTPTT